MLRMLHMKLHVKRTLSNLGIRSLKTIDFTEPHLWYGEARLIKRKIICHVGGTNSGKTYTALSALAAANNGIYCGPLRLLAWEVHQTLTNKGVKCSLMTGQEKELAEDETHVSCTVEMADLRKAFDVAVIDEVQLLGDESRGWAWTQAFLGLQAREIHLCGSPSVVPIIKELCALTNDTLTIKKYTRLTPLTVSAKSLKTFQNVEAGDCVIGFGRKHLYETKKAIETVNPGLRCSVIYGGLPPEARKAQALLFSTPDSGYDVLVASDAIGMGLNLSIKRIVFSTVQKFDGRTKRFLDSAEIKQIAGRAGRYGTQYESGEVTCMTADDLKYVRVGMQKIDALVEKAGLFPSLEQLQLLSVLLNLRVNADLMHNFWSDYAVNEWGAAVKEDKEKDADVVEDMSGNKVFNSLSTSSILRTFGSIKTFARELEDYVHRTGHDVINRSWAGKLKKPFKRENNAHSNPFPAGSYDAEPLKVQTDDEASKIEAESKRSLDDVRIAFVRGDKISDEESAALEKSHLRRMDLATEGGSSRSVSPIKRALEALQENNIQKKLGAVGAPSDTPAGRDPLVETVVREEDTDSNGSSNSASSSSGSGRGRDKDSHRDKGGMGGNKDHGHGIRDGSGMDYDILDFFLNGDQSEQDARAPRNRGPILLSKLLSVFRKNIDMGDNKTYFLCNLDDKIALAEMIDDVPMSFNNRYTFIMAPVSSDNREMMGNFKRFAESFCTSGIVKLSKSCLNRGVPRNPNEMLEIESLHQYFECYLWLNQRFSSAFVDSERALQESKHCAGLAEKALKAFADTAASTQTERKARNKAVLQVDRIFQSSEDVLTRSGKPKIETIYRRERSGSASDRRK